MTYAIKHLFHIDAPRTDVFKAISTIDGLSKWWTTQTTGNAEMGGVIQFRFGDMGPDMKVTEVKPNKCVSWKCIDSQGWDGHIFSFELSDNEGKTRVRFSHDGWKEQDDFYAHCCFSWGRYMESLRQLCQTGKGEAFGSEGYRK